MDDIDYHLGVEQRHRQSDALLRDAVRARMGKWWTRWLVSWSGECVCPICRDGLLYIARCGGSCSVVVWCSDPDCVQRVQVH